MPIDVEPRDLGKVVQLVANPEGWSREHTSQVIDRTLYIGGNTTQLPVGLQDITPLHLREPLNRAYLTTKEKRPDDWNGLKVYIKSLRVRDDGKLITEAILTDYYTLWGLPQAAPELFAQHEAEVVINRATKPGEALYIPTLPWGACSHNILLDPNGDVYAMVRSRSQGFHAGRLSATEEEQAEPEDASIFKTSARSFLEELGIVIPEINVRLLGAAEEKGAAYPALALVTQTLLKAQRLLDHWRGNGRIKQAKDYNDNTALFLIPNTEIDLWISQEQIRPEIWGKHLIAGAISPDAIIALHPTVPWRLGLAKEYTKLAR